MWEGGVAGRGAGWGGLVVLTQQTVPGGRTMGGKTVKESKRS